MRKVLLLSAVVCVLGFANRASADDDANAILEKAVKAHGGKEKLAKLKDAAVQMKAKGTSSEAGGIKLEMETFAQGGKFKQVIGAEVDNKKVATTVGFDGKTLWFEVGGKVLTAKDVGLDEKKLNKAVEDQLYQERVASLAFVGDKGYELAPLGEMKVDGKPAVGIRVTSKGHPDVNLYFDKDKGLLVKMEGRSVNFLNGQEATEEKVMSDYKEIEGIQRPTKIVGYQDGKKVLDVEITELKTVDKLDDSVFAKP
jgi:hypothetical protein